MKIVIPLLASMSKKYMATYDLGIYLYNITNIFHGNKPCQAVRCHKTDFWAIPKYNSNTAMNTNPAVYSDI